MADEGDSRGRTDCQSPKEIALLQGEECLMAAVKFWQAVTQLETHGVETALTSLPRPL